MHSTSNERVRGPESWGKNVIFLCYKGRVYPVIFESPPRSNQTSATKLLGLRKDTRKERKKRGERRKKSGIKSQKKRPCPQVGQGNPTQLPKRK